MVPTEAFDNTPKSHTRRELAGFFNRFATAVKHPLGLQGFRPDPAIVENARVIIMKTVFHWGVAHDEPRNARIGKPCRRNLSTIMGPTLPCGALYEPRV